MSSFVLVASLVSSITYYCTKATSVRCRTGLRSGARDELVVRETKYKFGDRSFSVDGLAAWNALPSYIMDASSVGIFKSRLKTHLPGLSND